MNVNIVQAETPAIRFHGRSPNFTQDAPVHGETLSPRVPSPRAVAMAGKKKKAAAKDAPAGDDEKKAPAMPPPPPEDTTAASFVALAECVPARTLVPASRRREESCSPLSDLPALRARRLARSSRAADALCPVSIVAGSSGDRRF